MFALAVACVAGIVTLVGLATLIGRHFCLACILAEDRTPGRYLAVGLFTFVLGVLVGLTIHDVFIPPLLALEQ